MSLVGEFEPLPSVRVQQHGLLEGPRVDADGTVTYSDVLGGGVYRTQGVLPPETVVPKRRGIGGLVPHRDGGLVVTGRTVQHVDGDAARDLLAVDGVHGFNDLTATPAGDVLAGALRFSPFSGEQAVPGEVWRIGAGGETEVFAEGVDWPNGIGVSQDGARVYVSDTAKGIVHVFENGSAATFAPAPRGVPDGLAVDAAGGVWVALGNGGIVRFDSAGELDELIDGPASFVSSVTFGGADGRLLYATTADGDIFRAPTEVAGLPVTPAAV